VPARDDGEGEAVSLRGITRQFRMIRSHTRWEVGDFPAAHARFPPAAARAQITTAAPPVAVSARSGSVEAG
jgi:hypothetical protein